ncbi:MAG: hypothetical protein ISS45_09170 [Candidatus Omnitrophica bacterium]|nr:hypothetical protein [Candidatus Omnitrophota bacterium]
MKDKIAAIILFSVFIFNFTLISQSNIYCDENNIVQVISLSETIELHKPLKIEEILYYKDGGTIGFVIKDSKGKIFQFCLDGRMRVATEPGFLGELKNLMTTQKPYHFYFEVTHPEGSGAQEIPIGGKEEESIAVILEHIMSEKLSDEQMVKLNSADCSQFSKEEFKDCVVLGIIKKIKDRQDRNIIK